MIMKKNIFKKAILAILAVAMLTAAVAPANTYAASKTATTTKSYKPMNPDSLIKALSVYGQDTFKITYDKSSKKIISCKASQTAKNLGHTIIEKGGIKLVSKSKTTWTYKATWYLNFKILPTPIKALAKVMKCKYAELSDLGRIATVTVTYKVSAGSLKHSQSYKFTVPSKLNDAVKKLGGLFTSAF